MTGEAQRQPSPCPLWIPESRTFSLLVWFGFVKWGALNYNKMGMPGRTVLTTGELQCSSVAFGPLRWPSCRTTVHWRDLSPYKAGTLSPGDTESCSPAALSACLHVAVAVFWSPAGSVPGT